VWDGLLDRRDLSNEAFLEHAYQQLFSRPVDGNGIGHFGVRLQRGEDRRTILLEIASAPERLYVVSRQLGL
jgi:hypothetical protein